MAEDTSSETGSQEQGGVTLVPVPQAQAEAVMEFVAGLQSRASDVSGHMISGGLTGGLGGGLAAKGDTSTGCTSYSSGKNYDLTCDDTDKIVIK
jgi:hypothetical protein